MPTSKEEKEAGWLSVTEVLDAFIPKGLLDWYLKTGKKEAKRLSTVALKIGSRVDELVCQDVKVGSYKLTPKDPIEVKNCMEAWESFKRDYSPEITGCQIEVKDEKALVLGHIDLLIKDEVTDIKCASSVKDNYWLQIGKYRGIGGYSGSGHILRLDKNLGTYQFVSRDGQYLDYCARVFDGLLEAHRYYNPPKEEKEELCQTS